MDYQQNFFLSFLNFFLFTLLKSYYLKKILIFDKNRIWKVFVEMDNEQEAEIAKTNLDGDVILHDGSKMNVYYSNLQQVSFQNSNSGGVGKNKIFSISFSYSQITKS